MARPLRAPLPWGVQASMGIYLFKREVLEELLRSKDPSGSGKQDEHFGYDVVPHALRSGAKVSPYPLHTCHSTLVAMHC